jgi:hypothetical protein
MDLFCWFEFMSLLFDVTGGMGTLRKVICQLHQAAFASINQGFISRQLSQKWP